MKKSVRIMSAVLSAVLAFSLASCGKKPVEAVSEDPSEKTSISETTSQETVGEFESKTENAAGTTAATAKSTTTAATAAESTDYVSAYRNYLKQYIEESNSGISSGITFSLHYVDNDDIPELFVGHGRVKILTFDGKEVKEIGEAGEYNHLGFAEKQGIIVETRNKKMHVMANVYEIKDGKLIEKWSGTHRLGGYPAADTPESYFVDGNTVDKATYEKELVKNLPATVKTNNEELSADEYPGINFVVDGSEYQSTNENIDNYIK